MASSSLYFLNFKLKEKLSIDEVINTLLISRDEDKFVINDTTEKNIDGYYVTSINTKELVFNVKSEQIESIIIKKDIIIHFSIDLERELLDVWGRKIYINKFLTQINILFNHKINIEPIGVELDNLVPRLAEANIIVRTVKIDNYLLEEDIIANCVFDLKNHKNPYDILSRYSDKIIYVSLTIIINEFEEFSIMLYKNGSIVVYKHRDELEEADIESIRKICLGQEEI